jgi:LemA protein
MALQSQLEGTENRIAFERKKFNDVVATYNASIRRFPTLITAKIFGFKKRGYFEAEQGAEKAPSVKF